MTTSIRAATPADAPRLSELGAATFRDAFGDANRPADVDRHLADAFTPARQAVEIADPVGLVLLAEEGSATGAAELIGYGHLVGGRPPGAVTGPVPLELKRLYAARAWHGREEA